MYAYLHDLIDTVQMDEKEACIPMTEDVGNVEVVNSILDKLRDIRGSAQHLLDVFKKHGPVVQPKILEMTVTQISEAENFVREVSDFEFGLRILMPLEGDLVHTAHHFLLWEVVLPVNSDAHVIVILDGKIRYQAWLNCSISCGDIAFPLRAYLVGRSCSNLCPSPKSVPGSMPPC